MLCNKSPEFLRMSVSDALQCNYHNFANPLSADRLLQWYDCGGCPSLCDSGTKDLVEPMLIRYKAIRANRGKQLLVEFVSHLRLIINGIVPTVE